MPAPPSVTEALQRVNAALPAGLAVAFRPIARGGRRSPTPWRVLFHGRPVDQADNLTAAIFKAMRRSADPRLDQESLPWA